jgi:peptidoglycan hydrolase-like protein with peptidoglycan-binding domain
MAGGTPRSTSSRAKASDQEPEPRVAPTTPSGVSPRPVTEIELTVVDAPKLELQEDATPDDSASPEQGPTPERLPRLNERLSPINIMNSINDGYPSRAVAFIQGALAGTGHDPGPFDGVGGQKTRNALTEFAATRGLELNDLDSLARVLDELGFDV